ncbi:fumarylacetoacetate hydrolase family protein [Streptomyces sp. NPDC051636]|uniref:fumarylacetoacetate hydrolase family protein n=1 Tax=Streptomyces sp. NPDC051636 TaxID=3365663 RepID=UPI0037AD6951
MKPVTPPVTIAGTFALGTLSAPDQAPFPGLVVPAGQVLDLCTALGEPRLTTRGLFERWDEVLPRLRALATDASESWLPLEGLRVHAPIDPLQVFQAGANYRQHAIEMEIIYRPADDPRTAEQARADLAAEMDRRAAEEQPYVFIGLPSAVTGPYDDVVLPAWAEKPDWELELAAVIGRPAHRLSPEEALDYVAGYTIANDLTDRAGIFRKDVPAIGTDWLRCKNAPGFTPLGPWIVPSESIADPQDLHLTLKLNGETMQDESTKDMIFTIARIVSHISQTAQLVPGDLILTGSPTGNGVLRGILLRDGDVMESTIGGLGVQRTRCVAERPS